MEKISSSKRSAHRRKINSRQGAEVARSAVVDVAPIVDVPRFQQDDVRVKQFGKDNYKWFSEFLEEEFVGDDVDEAMTDAVIKEVAECIILNRTAKSCQYWDSSTIEFIIRQFNQRPIQKRLSTRTKYEEPRSKEKKGSAKKKTQVKGKNKRSKKSSDGKAKTNKAVGRPGVISRSVTKKDVRSVSGIEQWKLAIGFLRRERQFWCQAQDVDMLAQLLMDVEAGKAQLPENTSGSGTRGYGRDKLLRCVHLVKELVR